ncbi:hypothetical protein GC176_25530 [bacterium]|nr:hypothetical protein [bacterium]
MTRSIRRWYSGLLSLALLTGCGSDNAPTDNGGRVSLEPAEAARLQTEVMTFCGGCHGPPQPDSFPRDAWYHEIELAYRLFAESGRQDLTPPPMADIVRWYRSQAPEKLTLRKDVETPSPIRFRRQSISEFTGPSDDLPSRGPGVSYFLISNPIAGSTRTDGTILFCDMSRNGVFALTRESSLLSVDQVATAQNPVHLEQTDLNADGKPDYLLCEMGSFLPEDHDRGRLLWLNGLDAGVSKQQTLVDHVGRVVDARPGDFDGDGDLDVIVAVFGWRKTGQLLYLEQMEVKAGIPQFRSRQLDDRHGAIHLPTVDLDADGDLDFVVLFSQEHETVEAFLNRGDGTFERQIVYLTGSPSYGSSGIELVDFDNDGDTDVLYTNGDTLDSSLLKPYHSVQWLENQGNFPFEHHHIGWLPGAYRAVTADIDADGDLDVVVCAWVPEKAEPPSPRDGGKYATLVWYEQQSDDRFACHVLQTATGEGYMTVAIGKLNTDGAPDIVAGRFAPTRTTKASGLDVFWNQSRP